MLDKPKIMEIVNNVKHVLAGDYQDVGEDYNIDAGADEHTNKKKVKYLVILSHKLTKWRSANEGMLRHMHCSYCIVFHSMVIHHL